MIILWLCHDYLTIFIPFSCHFLTILIPYSYHSHTILVPLLLRLLLKICRASRPPHHPAAAHFPLAPCFFGTLPWSVFPLSAESYLKCFGLHICGCCPRARRKPVIYGRANARKINTWRPQATLTDGHAISCARSRASQIWTVKT